MYGSRSYIAALRARGGQPAWLGVECCGFHRAWTRDASGGHCHNFYLDDTLLTKAALKQDLGLAYLPCFMGDTDPDRERYCPPDPQLNLGLWLLFHPDLKRTARVLAFRDHMVAETESRRELFEGKRS